MRAFEHHTQLIDELYKEEQVTRHVTKDQLTTMFEPESYLGLSTAFVDRVLNSAAKRSVNGTAQDV